MRFSLVLHQLPVQQIQSSDMYTVRVTFPNFDEELQYSSFLQAAHSMRRYAKDGCTVYLTYADI